MEKTYKQVPFDIELAKKIQSGKVEGRIVAENAKGIIFPIRIICYDAKNMFPNVGLAFDPSGNEYTIMFGKSGNNFDNVSIYIELSEETQNLINSKSLFDNWQDIQNTLNNLFREKASKNNAKFSDDVLVHYAAELFTWFRETHLIFKFRLDKLEELKQYAEEHIMEPSWCDEVKQNIKEIFGLESFKHEFNPFDKVLVIRNGGYGDTLGTWTPAIFQKYVTEYGKQMYLASGLQWHECIPYEGNEHLVGTTDKPK